MICMENLTKQHPQQAAGICVLLGKYVACCACIFLQCFEIGKYLDGLAGASIFNQVDEIDVSFPNTLDMTISI